MILYCSILANVVKNVNTKYIVFSLKIDVFLYEKR